MPTRLVTSLTSGTRASEAMMAPAAPVVVPMTMPMDKTNSKARETKEFYYDVTYLRIDKDTLVNGINHFFMTGDAPKTIVVPSDLDKKVTIKIYNEMDTYDIQVYAGV